MSRRRNKQKPSTPTREMAGWRRKADPTYATQIQFYTPGQIQYMSRDVRGYIREGYRKVGVVYTCINKIANAAAGIRWKLYVDRAMQEEIDDHPLLDLWRNPNPRQGTAEFIENLFGYWHLSGNSYIWANRPSPSSPPGELWMMRPDWMRVIAGQKDIQGYKYGPNVYTATPYAPEEIMHLKFPAYDEDLYGLSPVEVSATLVEQTNEGNRWNTALMQNFGKPSSAFFSKHLLTEPQREQISEEILDKYSGSENAGYPLIIESDMTWQQLSLSPAELDWLESRNVNKRDIAMIFDVAPELVGDTASKTFANAEQAEQHLYTDNVLPKLDKVSDHLNIWLVHMYPDLKESGAYFTYDRDDIEALASLIQTAKQQKSERSNANYKASKITLNEAREEDGYPPLMGGDRLLIGATLIPLTLLAEPVIISVSQNGVIVDPLEGVLAPPAPAPPPLALPSPSTPPTTQITEEPQQQGGEEGGGGSPPAPEGGKRAEVPPVWEEKDVPPLLLHPQGQAFHAGLTHYFVEEQRDVLRGVQHAETLTAARTAIDTMLSAHQSALKSLFIHHYTAIGNAEASQTALQLGGKRGQMRWEQKAARPMSDDPMDLASYAARRITGIEESTRADVESLFGRAFAEEWSIPDLANGLQNLYTGFSQGRSLTIARTEVMTASNLGRYVGARSLGLPVTKAWVATNDGKTRPAHREADGQEVELTASFEIGGEWMAFPGDSSRGASADNIACCRCTFSVALAQEKRRPSDHAYRALLKGW